MGVNPEEFPEYIRFAAERDLPKIMEIERLSFSDPWMDINFKEALKDLFIVYESDEEVLGYLIACCCATANKAIILKVAVYPDQRGRGIATALLKAAIEELRLTKVGDVELTVDVVRTGAIRLYERLGFKILKVVDMDYENADESFYIMTMRLNN
jgi:ribosomal-protein-alanine N-acetyltransferase